MISELEYDFDDPGDLARFHQDLSQAADEIERWALEYGAEKDLAPALVADAMALALTRQLAHFHGFDADRTGKPTPDAEYEEQILDFRLAFLKFVADVYPQAMTDKLKRATRALNRQTQRRRRMANAPPTGEA